MLKYYDGSGETTKILTFGKSILFLPQKSCTREVTNMKVPKTTELFDLEHTLAKPLLMKFESDAPYLALPLIKDFIKELQKALPPDEYDEIDDGVFVAKGVKIPKTATIEAPVIIGKNTEIRPGAYIRSASLIGEGVVVGNSTEIKNAIIFDGVQIPHYNYVGDSILGYKSHMGAGAIASNFKLDGSNINVRTDEGPVATGLRKFGVMLGDHAEVGCNSVLFPGTVVGRGAAIYPLSRVRGVIPENHILNMDGKLIKKKQSI